MVWLLIPLIFLAYLVIRQMIDFPAFRGAVLVLVLAIGAGIAWIMDDNKKAVERYEQQEVQAALKRASAIAPNEVELSEVKLARDSDSETMFTFSGRIKNLSSTYPLASVRFRLKIFDCPRTKPADDCDVVGDSTEEIFVAIPSSQARTFESSLDFHNLPKLQRFKWSHEMVAIHARLPGDASRAFP